MSDIEMPRMDGLALSRTLAKERPELAFVLMSGCATEDQIPPGAAFLAKPFSEAVLILRLRQVLAAAGRSAATFASSPVVDAA